MKKDRTILNLWVGAIMIMFVLALWSYVDYKKSVNAAIEHKKTEEALQKELLLNASCNHHVDSLVYINGELSKFKSLTMAMVHREDATKDLKYQVGDIVYLKQDSSRVVIEDILIGGGKYNYFIKYRIIFKNDTSKEVTPEMVF
jgi:hypothetical protein